MLIQSADAVEVHSILYSYRRCPYAMRARMSIVAAGLQVEQREIVFWDKPADMLTASPKGTVPVLVLPNGKVVDESLDHYKYADRFPDESPLVYRQQGEVFLRRLEGLLLNDSPAMVPNALPGLVNGQSSFVDLAIFPFIRQFAHVDKAWFLEAPYPCLRRWLDAYISSDIFKSVMKNRPVWTIEHVPLWVDEPAFQTKDQFTAKAHNMK